MQLLKQSSTAQPLVFLLVDSTDHVTGQTGLTPTVTLSKAGGAFASPAGAVTEIANGWYKVAGNATDTGTLGPLILHATGTAADPVDILYGVVAFDPQDSVRAGLTALPNAAAGANTGLPVVGTQLPLALGANGNVKSDVRDYNGTAGTFAAGRAEVNTTHWSGTILAAADTAGYPKVTVKDGTGTGEIDTASGKVLLAAAQSFDNTGQTTGLPVSETSVRTAVGLASANLDTQFGSVNDNVQLVLDDTGSLLARLGAFTGSGLNTVLGFFRAMMRKTAALTPSDVAGTYDNTTDSQEAQKDAGVTVAAADIRSAIGLAAADLDDQLDAISTALAGTGGVAGSGADACTMNVKVGGNNVPDADVWVTSDAAGDTVVAGTKQTNSNGNVTFMLDDGNTYYLWAQKDGYNLPQGEVFTAEAD